MCDGNRMSSSSSDKDVVDGNVYCLPSVISLLCSLLYMHVLAMDVLSLTM